MSKLILNNVDKKWRNYSRFIKPIIEETKQVLNDERLEKPFTIILIDEEAMHQMNYQFRHLDRPTDILTFPDDMDEDYLGDIFINVKAIVDQAKQYQHSLKREFCFLVTHGILHLLGYDHHTQQEEKEMFGYQEEILKEIAPRVLHK